MRKLDHLLTDGLCPLMPLWNTMLIFEFTFLALILVSLFLNPGQPSVAISLSLFFIVPTTASLLGIIYFCKRKERASPFRREKDTPSTGDTDRSPDGDDGPAADDTDPSREEEYHPSADGDADPSRES